jgi:serine/threonine protein kinase
MQDLTGRTLNQRYRVERLIGRGGMAEVYLVTDLERGVKLAMKVLREDLAEDQLFLKRFKREAKVLSQLQHPNIVRFYGLEQEGHLAFLLMEYIDGITLRRAIFDRKRPFTARQVQNIISPICAALNYAHSMGMVHCDVKSANIMLDKNNKVYLTDFGIARQTESATATMVGAGAPAYMAPEQILGKDPLPQTDIYALGVVMYEMLSGGKRPFNGETVDATGSTTQKIAWEQVHRPAPSITDVNLNAPAGLDAIIRQCLRKNPSERFSSANDLLAALKNVDRFEFSGGSLDKFASVAVQEHPKQPKMSMKPSESTPSYRWLITFTLIACAAVVIYFNTGLSEKGFGFFTAATSTNTPRPTATRRIYTPTPVCNLSSYLKPGWRSIVCDAFTSSNSPFYTGSNSSEMLKEKVSIKNGKYVVDLTGVAYSGYTSGVVHRFNVGESKNFLISVDARVDSVYKHCGWGLAFRGDHNDYYLFQIQHDGYFSFQEYSAGKWTQLIGWRAHRGIKWDDPYNVTIIGDGDQFSFYINGEAAGSYEDSTLDGTNISLVVHASEGASATIEFDNLLIKAP